MQYSYNQLEVIKNDIKSYIRETEGCSYNLKQSLRWNLLIIGLGQSWIRDQVSLSNEAQLEDFYEKRQQLIDEYGGKMSINSGEVIIENFAEVYLQNEFRDRMDDLVNENMDILDEVMMIEDDPKATISFQQVDMKELPGKLNERYTETFLALNGIL